MRMCAIALVASAGAAAPSITQTPVEPNRRILGEFAARVHAYSEVKETAATTVQPLVVLPDPSEIRRWSDALATVIRNARWDARPRGHFHSRDRATDTQRDPWQL
jgi:hypothetical protein